MSNTKYCKKDEILAYEGEESKSLFVLVKGCLGVFKGDLKITEFSDKGTVVGEIGVILNKPRTATIKALEESYVVTISSNIDALIIEYPEITKKILRTLANRLTNITEDYWNLAERVDIESRL
ncbi:MAG: cyclic nucleotide-binding domain-containing protein [Ignavibacteria bacterium]|jgi:CRP-like cAMP-binding protein